MATIDMGDDEFILYVRKNGKGIGKGTAELGKSIWVWIKAQDPGAIQTKRSEDCRWGDVGPFVSPDDLPKTATQFRFDRSLLPALYDYLDTL